jgi:ABC-2 type transport system ATP-binding protein
MTAIPQGGASLEFLLTSKWYGQISALTDVSVRFTPGVTGLVGQNGAGKSTMMKLACGLLRPSFGEVFLNGEPPTSPRARQSLGYCSDIDKYYEHQSGFVFVQWMLRLSGASGRDARSKAGSLLDELGLGDAMHRKIGGYSKGMRQRVKLAVALGHDPNVLLMDEPLTGLDPVARQEMAELLRKLGDAGAVVVVSSHVLHELQTIADQVVLIHQGRKLAEGTVGEIRDKIDDRPRRVHLATAQPRELAARLFNQPEITTVTITHGGVEIATEAGHGVDGFLTGLGADGLIQEVVPLDDSLESVFGYLVN